MLQTVTASEVLVNTCGVTRLHLLLLCVLLLKHLLLVSLNLHLVLLLGASVESSLVMAVGVICCIARLIYFLARF